MTQKYKQKNINEMPERKGKIVSSHNKGRETEYFFPNERKTVKASNLKEAIKKLRKE
jgi:hypothetical protein